MRGNFEKCLAITLREEGGYSNDAGDPGGMTMEGITQREYNLWRRLHHLAKRWVKRISHEELVAIYKAEYWDACKCDELEAGVDLVVFDFAVNSGVGRALHTPRSGTSTVEIIHRYSLARLAYDKGLKRLWPRFGKGWQRRILRVEHNALVMAHATA